MSSRPTAPTPSAGTSSPQSSPGTATASRRDDRRGGQAVPQAAVVDLLLLRPVRPDRLPAAGRRGLPARREGELTDLDRWALSRTAATAGLVTERLEAYDATTAGRAIAELLDELSNWYVRRSRRRFWDGDPAAFATLRECLLALAGMLAPFCPSSPMRSTTTSTAGAQASTCATSRTRTRSARRTRSSNGPWALRARPSGSAWAPGARRRSRYASRSPRPSSSPTIASARRSSGRRGRPRGAQRADRQVRRRGRRARQLRGQGPLPHLGPCSARTCRRWPRRSRRWIRLTSRLRCATAARSGSRSEGASTPSRPRT